MPYPFDIGPRKAKACYEWRNRQCRVNRRLFMGDLKLFGKDYNQIDPVVQTIHFVSSDIRIEFGIKKCGLLILRREKVVKVGGKLFYRIAQK